MASDTKPTTQLKDADGKFSFGSFDANIGRADLGRYGA
jgi:hypothetical protein